MYIEEPRKVIMFNVPMNLYFVKVCIFASLMIDRVRRIDKTGSCNCKSIDTFFEFNYI